MIILLLKNLNLKNIDFFYVDLSPFLGTMVYRIFVTEDLKQNAIFNDYGQKFLLYMYKFGI